MFAAERREAILALVFADGRARTADLARSLDVSEVTIRADLDALVAQGRLERVHGGATLPQHPLVGFDQRSGQHVEAKQRIAAAAARLVRDGTTIALDSGTTCLALADRLPTVADLVVVTPGLPVALRLLDVAGVEVRLLGGRVDPRTKATVGPVRTPGQEGAITHVAFVGAGGVDADLDVVEGAYAIAEAKRDLVASARRRVLLADSSKWSSTDRHKAVGLGAFDTVVTDVDLPAAAQAAVRAAGVELVLV